MAGSDDLGPKIPLGADDPATPGKPRKGAREKFRGTSDKESVVALREELELLNAVADDLDRKQERQAKAVLDLLEKQNEQAKIQLERIQELQKAEHNHQVQMHEALALGNDAEADKHKRMMEYVKQRRIHQEQADLELIRTQVSHTTQLEALRKKYDEQRSARSRKFAAQASEQLYDFAVNSASAAKNAFVETLEEAGPALTALATLKPELGPVRVLGALETEFKSYDDSYRSVVKSVGLQTQNMREIFDRAYDPISFAMKEYGKNAEEQAEKGKIAELNLYDIGLTSKDVAAAYQTLVGSVSLFRSEMTKGDKESTASMLNMVAGLKKLGIAEADSGKAMDQFVKVMGKTPARAQKQTTSLLNLAKSLNMNAGKAVKDFTALMPDLAAYGDRATEVFAKMAAQANATGLEIGNLNSYAKKMDTFKGAAEIAQRFNAQLGGMYLSSIDLAKADLPDKITMIQDAMARSGKSFDDFGRRGKMALAAALGLEDTEAAARILNAKEEFEEANKSVNTATMSNKELREAVEKSMTQLELQTKAISRHGAGFSKFTQRTRKLAIEGANAITNGFRKAKEETSSAEEASVGMLFAYKGMEGTAGALTERLKGVTRATQGAAAALGIAVGAASVVGVGIYGHASAAQKVEMDRLYEEKEKGYKEELIEIAKKVQRKHPGLKIGERMAQVEGRGYEADKDPDEDLVMVMLGRIQEASKDKDTPEAQLRQDREEMVMALQAIRRMEERGTLSAANVENITLQVDGEALGQIQLSKLRERLHTATGIR